MVTWNPHRLSSQQEHHDKDSVRMDLKLGLEITHKLTSQQEQLGSKEHN